MAAAGLRAGSGEERPTGMYRRFLKSKLRDLRISGMRLDYPGSITLDRNYLEAADILPHEEVQVLNIESGSRITTYALVGKRGSGVAELNGPAAHSGSPGDRIFVLTYCTLAESEIAGHRPRVVSAARIQGARRKRRLRRPG